MGEDTAQNASSRPLNGSNKSGGTTADKKNNATTAASAAGARAVVARMAAFYFRAPTKFFFRTRIDYLAYPRALLPTSNDASKWSLSRTTPAILANAVRTYGWSFLPSTVLPPLLANVTVGAVLYTTYLSALSTFSPSTAISQQKRAYPPPEPVATFAAGATAGVVQALIAAPLDALTVRFRTADLLSQRYGSMWSYAASKSREIGLRGAYAGVSLSLVKDGLAGGLFFATFETVKAQGFYGFVRWWYGADRLSVSQKDDIAVQSRERKRPVIKPYYMLEPAFLTLAGAAASVAQQLVVHPFTQVQEVHHRRLVTLDEQLSMKPSGTRTLGLYTQAYGRTFWQCLIHARKSGGWRSWLFADFWMSTLRQVPSTSAGLIIFEVFRRKYGIGSEPTRIQMDGYDILLP